MVHLDLVAVCGRHGHIDEGGALITCQDAGPHQGTFSCQPLYQSQDPARPLQFTAVPTYAPFTGWIHILYGMSNKHLCSMAATMVTNLKKGTYISDIHRFRELLLSNQDWFRECEVQAWQVAAAMQATVQLYWESTSCSAIQAVHSQHLHDEHNVRALSRFRSSFVNRAILGSPVHHWACH